MNRTIEEYLSRLKKELSGSDKATIQDATADAQEHLVTALASHMQEKSGLLEEEVLDNIIAEYGSPEEIAAAYKQAEIYMTPYIAVAEKTSGQGILSRFFGVYSDPAAWGSFLYMVIALVTGILYFCWVTAGIATTLSFSLFLFGIPLAVLFLLSLQGLAVMEGRIVEGLLGVRMPRRPIFFPQKEKWFDRLKLYLSDQHTWFGLLYMLFQLPLGVLYFTVAAVMLPLGVGLIAAPFIQEMLNVTVITLGGTAYLIPGLAMPFVIALGGVLITAFMHLAKGVGKLHGLYAKRLLVAN